MLLHAPPTETMAVGFSELVKVLDFGIAKVLQNTHGDGQIKTRTGVMIGTPTYMAPEQCGGDGEVCDRTDVYALGIMMYEMLSGRPPFIGDQDAQIIGKQLFAQPTPLQTLVPTVDAPLAALVHRMLAKDTAARPAMRDVAAELLRLRQVGVAATSASAQVGLVVAQTVHMSDTRHTTLGQATGQLQKGPRLRPLHLVIAAGCLLLAGAGALVASRNHGARPPSVASASGSTNAPASVRWHIVSEPAGAEVVSEPEGQVLGVTPLDYTVAASPGAQAVVLRQRGFAERRLLLSRSTDEQRNETLLAMAVPTPTPVGSGPAPGVPAPPPKPKAQKPAEAGRPTGGASRSVSSSASRPLGKHPPSALRNEQVPLFR